MKSSFENSEGTISGELEVFEYINKNLKHLEINEMVDLLGPLKIGMTMETPILPAGEFLYRGRVISQNFNKEMGIKVTDLIYPPPDKTRLNRVNRPGSPMFYCASSKEAIFHEVPNLNQGAEFILTIWRTAEKFVVSNIGYTDHSFRKLQANRECPKWGRQTSLAPVAEERGSETVKTVGRSKEENEAILKAFSDAFTCVVEPGKSDEYKLTTAISEVLLGEIVDSPLEFAGVMYPTIQLAANGDNLALFPKFVDRHLQFKMALHIRVDERTDTSVKYAKIDSAIDLRGDGTLNWLGRLPNWTLDPGPQAIVAVANSGRDIFGDYTVGENGEPLHWVLTDQLTGEVIRPS